MTLAALFGYLYSTDLSDVTEGQLESLRSNKLTEAYYKYTSTDFQSSTPFEKFKEFVRSYPILLHHTSVTFSDSSTKKNLGSIRAVLETNGKTEAEIKYKLIKEGDNWRILSMQLVEYRDDPVSESSETGKLITPIENQLDSFRKNDLVGAYKGIVSKEFEKETPFEKFKTFVMGNPVLTEHKTYYYKEHHSEGDKGFATVVLDPDGQAIFLEYKLTQEEGRWHIAAMRIIPPTDAKTHAIAMDMISTITKQLDLLKKRDIDSAYNEFIAGEQKKETTLEKFRDFIKNYPAFTNYTSMNVKEPYIENNIGKITIELLNDEGTTVVDYTLGFEDNAWKIWGMHVQSIPSTTSSVENTEGSKGLKTRDIITVIQNFLKALQEKDFKKAYDEYLSKGFKSTNPFNTYEEFFKKHPEFIKSTSSNFDKLIFNNNIATFSGHLILTDEMIMPVEFDLIQEEGGWKILYISALPAYKPSKTDSALSDKQKAAGKPLEFKKVILGNAIDEEGDIIKPSTTFKSNSGDIYIRLYIENSIPGIKIELVLRHVESGSSIKPVSAQLDEEGNTVVTFVFSPPQKGWPKGNYQLRVSSAQAHKTFTFKVE